MTGNIDLKWFTRKQYQKYFREFIFTNNLIGFRDVDGMLDDLLKQIYITNEISEAISTVSGEENNFDEVCFTLEVTGKK